MPLYTLDGELLGVVCGAGSTWQAFPVEPAVQNLRARASRGERLASVGVVFQELTAQLQQVLGEGGVLISDVVEGGPAALVGVQTGDVLLRVGEVDVATIDAAARAVNAAPVGTVTNLEVRRTGRIRRIEVAPALAFQVTSLAGRDRVRGSSLVAAAVFPPDLLDTSGIPPDAQYWP